MRQLCDSCLTAVLAFVVYSYDEIKGFDGCRQLDDAMQLKYIMGHTHCNEVTATDSRGDKPALGMMVAGQGMEGCGGSL